MAGADVAGGDASGDDREYPGMSATAVAGIDVAGVVAGVDLAGVDIAGVDIAGADVAAVAVAGEALDAWGSRIGAVPAACGRFKVTVREGAGMAIVEVRSVAPAVGPCSMPLTVVFPIVGRGTLSPIEGCVGRGS